MNASGSNACDTIFLSGPQWMRFIGVGGTQLSTSPTVSNRCGSQAAGWYTGLVPTVAQTVTNGRVCFSWNDNICAWSNMINVTNCGSFYVYQLSMPPICAARYCTETETPVIPPTTTTSTSKLIRRSIEAVNIFRYHISFSYNTFYVFFTMLQLYCHQ